MPSLKLAIRWGLESIDRCIVQTKMRAASLSMNFIVPTCPPPTRLVFCKPPDGPPAFNTCRHLLAGFSRGSPRIDSRCLCRRVTVDTGLSRYL